MRKSATRLVYASAVALVYGLSPPAVAHAGDSHEHVGIAPSITVSVTLPTTLLYDFYRLRRTEMELDRNDAVADYIDSLQVEDRIALAQLLLDDRDVRVRAFAIVTLSEYSSVETIRAALGEVARRIGLEPVARAQLYAALRYDMSSFTPESEVKSADGGDRE